ncbi:MAG: flagella basal body P-ring formation protein FlgA [Spirochaetales bacterium]|nr:flagella basal body P-ring formation protein FlgA [Spirochaetales bacterium]
MNHLRRVLITILLLTAFLVAGICEVTHVSLREFNDQTDDFFLEQLLNFLETVTDFSDSGLEVELVGKLPSITPGRSLDFYLIDTNGEDFAVLYRHRGEASYKRAALIVKEAPVDRDITAQDGSSAEPDFAAVPYRIEKGEHVNVSISAGSIRLDIGGEALQSGIANERIRVKVLETGKELIGTVTGPLEVRIDQ